MNVADRLKALDEARQNGIWIPGTGEEIFKTRTGRRLLYCWQPSTGKHAYLDCDTDIFLDDEEARIALDT